MGTLSNQKQMPRLEHMDAWGDPVSGAGDEAGMSSSGQQFFVADEHSTSSGTRPDELRGRSLHGGTRSTPTARRLDSRGEPDDPVGKLLASVFGAEAIKQVIRAYTFISKYHQPGDEIRIVGFGRGVHTARALTALICSQGLLDPARFDLANRELAYRLGAAALRAHRAQGEPPTDEAAPRRSLLRLMHRLPDYARLTLKAADMIPASAACVAVWDSSSSALSLHNFDIHIYRGALSCGPGRGQSGD